MKSCFFVASEEEEGTCKSPATTVWSSASSRGVGFVIAGLVFLVVLVTARWIDLDASFLLGHNSSTAKRQARRRHRVHSPTPTTPISFRCNETAQPTCHRANAAVASAPSPSVPAVAGGAAPPSCPDYFRYIYEDLRPWNATGITKEIVESAQRFADFRLVVLDGRAYVETYRRSFQTRDVFTQWGIVQLLNRYPGRVPDLELMFNCGDMPEVRAADHPSPPPPLFRYCKDESTVDILFPDWSFWGWPEVNIRPWEPLIEEIRQGNKRVKWQDREPYAYWKGNPYVSWTRQDLLACNVSNGREWNVRVFKQDWGRAIQNGFKRSNLADQCLYRYKIYIEGRAWSVSEKYILACNSPMLLVTTPYEDFFSRGLIAGKHYWPIRSDRKCKSIKFAVDWGNKHPKQAQLMGEEGSGFTQDELSMDDVYDYILHVLTEYAKLLRYKPTKPEKATELCLESMACPARGLDRTFMTESMAKYVADYEPCAMPPPFSAKELREMSQRTEEVRRKVERMEGGR